MAESKQSHLNGAYYGPAIPPPTQSYHSHGRGSGCGPCCLIGLLFKILITIVIMVGIAVLVLWLVFRPTKVKFHVVNASLTQFDYANNTLRYNLALDISVRNSNKKISVYYDRIEANAYYHDKRFDTEWLTPFYQGRKNTTMIKPVFRGEAPVWLGSSEVADFNGEKSRGVFEVDVTLNLRVRFKVGSLKTKRFKPKINCDLRIPLAANGGGSIGAFETKKCSVDLY